MAVSGLQHVVETVIYSCDPYVLSWASLLLMRDWRTHVVAEVESLVELTDVLGNIVHPIDIVIIDLDNISLELSLDDLIKYIDSSVCNAKYLFLCKKGWKKYIPLLTKPNLAGLIRKLEIDFSLAWAVSASARGQKVITRSVERLALQERVDLSSDFVVMENPKSLLELTRSETRNARMAFVFSMARSNIADELNIGVDSTWTLTSRLYDLLGVNELLQGKDWTGFMDEDDKILTARLKELLELKTTNIRKGAKETLAFHMLTKPVTYPLGEE